MLKFFGMLICVGCQLTVLWCSDLYNKYENYHLHETWPLALQGILFNLLITAILHTLDRQGEFVARTDFLWKAKLKVEQEEVETMRGINKVGSLSRN